MSFKKFHNKVLNENTIKNYNELVELNDLSGVSNVVKQYAQTKGYSSPLVFHGTTHQFNIFKKDRGNPENDLGIGFYFTTSDDDVSENYASFEGSDLKIRVEERAEELEQIEELDSEDALHQAQEELMGSDLITISAYLKLDNPVVLGKDATFIDCDRSFDQDDLDSVLDEAKESVIEEYDIEEDELDEYDDELRDKQEEILYDNGYEPTDPVMEALDNIKHIYNDIAEGFDRLYEACDASSLEQIVRTEIAQYVTDNEGGLVTGEFIRHLFEEMGFDSIIDKSVGQKFSNMVGVNGATHFICFEAEQIKSADPITYYDSDEIIPLDKRFDSNSEDIRF